MKNQEINIFSTWKELQEELEKINLLKAKQKIIHETKLQNTNFGKVILANIKNKLDKKTKDYNNALSLKWGYPTTK